MLDTRTTDPAGETKDAMRKPDVLKSHYSPVEVPTFFQVLVYSNYWGVGKENIGI